ncbi:hypothetical protein FNV43_RR26997 [Rhamnella rubrinervis]|uniref:Uncharacterized protein n=1 Tax=Rhamnella rubrinervis TaxID=2594499 RepID=A0A8K0DQD3_9ROSA|nr:hypothetical protein FNV43_RR26997 [Rhamnella rubrinervis]
MHLGPLPTASNIFLLLSTTFYGTPKNFLLWPDKPLTWPGQLPSAHNFLRPPTTLYCLLNSLDLPQLPTASRHLPYACLSQLPRSLLATSYSHNFLLCLPLTSYKFPLTSTSCLPQLPTLPAIFSALQQLPSLRPSNNILLGPPPFPTPLTSYKFRPLPLLRFLQHLLPPSFNNFYGTPRPLASFAYWPTSLLALTTSSLPTLLLASYFYLLDNFSCLSNNFLSLSH